METEKWSKAADSPLFIGKIKNYFKFFRKSRKNIEMKLVQKVENFHTSYEIALGNKKFSQKSQELQINF